ncbi:hypothetical protein Lalb_Chr06g0176271 [Lupinus albus]|uniref:Uncharacterized protein n=1 Tax=Lupinus albus TaxID=3870 RepID=A0A6A4QFV1_LUPAL|nr:hypothetical protein Lalb_Chr06g0176271 [Lupinus albus]
MSIIALKSCLSSWTVELETSFGLETPRPKRLSLLLDIMFVFQQKKVVWV